MKIFHISDLHIGRDLNGYNLIEDQRYALNQIYNLILRDSPKYLLIAGDIFDKYNPSNEAMMLFDEFLNNICKLNIRTIIISGNHDSKQKLAYLSGFLKNYNIYLFTDIIENGISFDDDLISFFPIPYLHEFELKKYNPDNLLEVDLYKSLIDNYFNNINSNYKSICLCHNLILGGVQSKSERSLSIGGIEELPASLFYKFDYTALGHLHINQKMGNNIYYSGSIMKYSISEFNNINGLYSYDTINNNAEFIEIPQLHNTRIIKDTIDNILINAKDDLNKNDYISVELLDDGIVYNAHKRLSEYYPFIVNITHKKYSNVNTTLEVENEDLSDPLDIFNEFYENTLSVSPNEDVIDYVKSILNNLMEE